MLQRHWEWQEDRRDELVQEIFRYKTAHWSKLGCQRGQPWCGVAYLDIHRTHQHLVARRLEEMKDVSGSACFENCDMMFRYSRCMRRGSVEAPVLWSKLRRTYCGKQKGSGEPKDEGLLFGSENLFSGMLWADNYW